MGLAGTPSLPTPQALGVETRGWDEMTTGAASLSTLTPSVAGECGGDQY